MSEYIIDAQPIHTNIIPSKIIKIAEKKIQEF